MKCFVTGAAGFIGSHLVDRLLAAGHIVVGYDNFSTGSRENLIEAHHQGGFTSAFGDVLDKERLTHSMRDASIVYHFAANADVRFGTQHPGRDLKQNTMATFRVLEAMRTTGAKHIVFASSGSVYGDAAVVPTPEGAPFPVQTSLYGASKAAAEGLIQAYCAGFGMSAHIFRFVSILGERYSHGHVIDFYRQLRDHPDKLTVLGDGRQRKSYLYVGDAIDAMLVALEKATDTVNIFNLGTDETCTVDDNIDIICEKLNVQPRIEYGEGQRGWVGDNPNLLLDTARIRALGWTPTLTIRESVIRTLEYLQHISLGERV